MTKTFDDQIRAWHEASREQVREMIDEKREQIERISAGIRELQIKFGL